MSETMQMDRRSFVKLLGGGVVNGDAGNMQPLITNGPKGFLGVMVMVPFMRSLLYIRFLNKEDWEYCPLGFFSFKKWEILVKL